MVGKFCMTFASQHSVVLVRVCHLVAGAVDLVSSMLHAVLHVLHRILNLKASLAVSPSYWSIIGKLHQQAFNARMLLGTL